MPEIPPYKIVKSKRKTLCLQVTPKGELTVRSPHYVNKGQIHDFVTKHHDWILKALEKHKERENKFPLPTTEEWETLCEKAKAEIPQRVAYFSSLMGLVPSKVTITRATNRFGSCSGKNSICFSALLIRYPQAAIDYVVVHELAHILHKNHGPHFWATVAEVLPDYKERKKLLKS